MKHNKQSFWTIPFYLVVFVVIAFFIRENNLSSFGIFSISILLLSPIIIFLQNHYFMSLEKTLRAFAKTHGGIVELNKLHEHGNIVCYDVIGSYHGRKFRIFTERIVVKGTHQMMSVLLKINSPVITSLRLRKARWGKIELDPSTIAITYDIQFNNPQKFATFNTSDSFIDLIDQQKLGADLSKLGKKYRDYLSRFQIYTDGKMIGVKKCKPIKSKEDLERLMSSLSELAHIIEYLSNK